jgi:hypothetical protein
MLIVSLLAAHKKLCASSRLAFCRRIQFCHFCLLLGRMKVSETIVDMILDYKFVSESFVITFSRQYSAPFEASGVDDLNQAKKQS